MHGKPRGFTLIELMVVVAVIAILTAIAYPSYVDHVRKTRYAQAKEGAQEVATALERYVSQQVAYPDDLSAANITNLPYADDQLSYTYTPGVMSDDNDKKTGYTLVVTEKTSRFGIWIGMNGTGEAGTHCGCDGRTCQASDVSGFDQKTVSCPDPTTAF